MKSKKYSLPLLIFILLTFLKFIPFIFYQLVPIPFDLLVGAYYPWLNSKWGYMVGVPVKNSVVTDVISQLYPWLHLAKQQILSGHLPLWNPTSFLGYPYFANYHSSFFYPTNIILLFGSLPYMRTIQLMIQQFLSLSFMFLYLRSIKISKHSAIFGAFVFVSSGLMMTDFEFASGSKALTWLPACLWLINKYKTTHKPTCLAGLSFSYAILLLSGHFQVSLYASIIILIATLYVARKERKTLLSRYLIAIIIGAVLASPQLLPTIELLSQSIRPSDSYITQVNYGILPIKHLFTTFISPDLFGNPSTNNYFGFWNYRESVGYIGIIPFFLVLISFLDRKYRLIKLGFIFTLALIFIPPIAYLPYQLKLPLIETAAASRLLFPFGFFAAILAAAGLDRLSKCQNYVAKVLATLWFIFLSVFTYYFFQFLGFKLSPHLSSATNLYLESLVSVRNLVIPFGLILSLSLTIFVSRYFKHNKLSIKFVVFVLIIITIADLSRFHYKFTPFTNPQLDFPNTPTTEYLQNHPGRIIQPSSIIFPANTWTPYGISSLLGYDPLYPTRNGVYFSAINSNSPNVDINPGRYLDSVNNFQSPLIDLASVRYVVAIKRNKSGLDDATGQVDYRIDNQKYHLVFEDKVVAIFENQNRYPYAYISYQPIKLSSDSEVLTNLLNNQYTYPALSTQLVQDYTNQTQPPTLIDSQPNIVGESNFTFTAEEKGLLVVSKPHYPGWKAFLDGKQVPIIYTNYLFTGIEVPSGNHTLSLRYQPKSFYIGIMISLGSAFTLLFWTIKKRKSDNFDIPQT